MSNITIQVLYRKLCDGDSISTPDLNRMYVHYRKLEQLAWQSGTEFTLAAKEARRVADACDSYLSARTLNECIKVAKSSARRWVAGGQL